VRLIDNVLKMKHLECVCVQVERAHLHSLSLVRSCIQKAVGLLRDPDAVASRSMQRMHILLTLLAAGQKQTGGECFTSECVCRALRGFMEQQSHLYSVFLHIFD